MKQDLKPAPGPPCPWWRRRWLFSLVLVAATCIAYFPALQGGFIWDDDLHVTENGTLRSLEGLKQMWFQFGAIKQYYPLVHTVFWVEYHLWGLNALGYHAVNVLLHGLAAILLWQTLILLEIPAAWLAAILFALHPVQVESVAWITECKNLLSAVFYFASAIAYLRFAECGTAVGSSRSRRGLYLAAWALFLMALLSKTVTCSLPAALLVVLWWKKGRLDRRDFLPLVPFVAMGAGMGVLTAWMEAHTVGARGAEWSLSWPERCLVAGRALWFYAAKLAWPANLMFSYPRWAIDGHVWWQWGFPLGAVGLVTVLWLMRRRLGRGPLAAVLFFGGTLVPALGFINVYPLRYSYVADHFQYLASVGLFVLAAAAMARWLTTEVLGWIAAVLAAVLGCLTWQQGGMYVSVEALWRTTLERNPDSFLAHLNLGTLLLHDANVDAALAHFEKAAAIKPNDAMAWMNLSAVALAQGRLRQAVDFSQKAVTLDPELISGHYNLAVALVRNGQPDLAIPHFQRVISSRPDVPKVHFDFGCALLRTQRSAEAVAHFQKALELRPDFPEARAELAVSLDRLGRFAESIVQYRQAAEAQPTNIIVLNNLAWALATCPEPAHRDGGQAVEVAERACRLTHFGEPQVVGTLAAAYAEAGRFPDAVAAAEKAKALAATAGHADLARRNEELQRLYRAGKAYHEAKVSERSVPEKGIIK